MSRFKKAWRGEEAAWAGAGLAVTVLIAGFLLSAFLLLLVMVIGTANGATGWVGNVLAILALANLIPTIVIPLIMSWRSARNTQSSIVTSGLRAAAVLLAVFLVCVIVTQLLGFWNAGDL